MKVCYFALRPVHTGDRTYETGEIIPEATFWHRVNIYVENGSLAPVLVATLPRDLQKQVKEWEEEQVLKEMLRQEEEEDVPDEAETQDDDGDGDEDADAEAEPAQGVAV